MKLRDYRVREALTLEEFGSRVGVTAAAVSRYEAGRIPDSRVLAAIIAATGGEVLPNDFFLDAGDAS